ncbi:hypothetical protein [Streptomyces cavernicola]|uniref:Uncharacterized protein n=1 Tax=Streptomyces cavernicola TaxID=3043613 RepID=A0ABT6S2P9_9ACTN|nr:hypothetical protein [Streptomyces sp. B-S-A6]MDI3402366.1 hypothetical protein [Streptomyces sp. B-S-A6]
MGDDRQCVPGRNHRVDEHPDRATPFQGGDLTCGGITSGLELAALWIVRGHLGADAATGPETMLEYEARGSTVWTRRT